MKLLAAVVEGLNAVFTKELLKPQAACLQQPVFIFCAQIRLRVHTPSPVVSKQTNPTRPSCLSGCQSYRVGYPAFCRCALHPFAENWLTASKCIRIRKVIFSVNVSKYTLTWSEILEESRQLLQLPCPSKRQEVQGKARLRGNTEHATLPADLPCTLPYCKLQQVN